MGLRRDKGVDHLAKAHHNTFANFVAALGSSLPALGSVLCHLMQPANICDMELKEQLNPDQKCLKI